MIWPKTRVLTDYRELSDCDRRRICNDGDLDTDDRSHWPTVHEDLRGRYRTEHGVFQTAN